jgi:phage-related protein
MSNLATGGHNRNNCPICRGAVYEVNMEAMDHHVNELVQHASMQNQYLQDELELTRQHREDLTAEYVRVMSMSMQIGLRHNQEREARDALERRAYICGLNERVAAVVTSAANNDLRRNGTFAHVEQQIRDLCMSFGMMAYDAQYDELLVEEQEQDPYADAMEVD